MDDAEEDRHEKRRGGARGWPSRTCRKPLHPRLISQKGNQNPGPTFRVPALAARTPIRSSTPHLELPPLLPPARSAAPPPPSSSSSTHTSCVPPHTAFRPASCLPLLFASHAPAARSPSVPPNGGPARRARVPRNPACSGGFSISPPKPFSMAKAPPRVILVRARRACPWRVDSILGGCLVPTNFIARPRPASPPHSH
ncbi:hypothetical protein OBBRIDRAFT_890527 [Obba rivulosa]|uniref:Uncharacterized protein n=1 Tax=Obba rivulosa TaxID=1052685 RepID=A0A8E2ALG7_9APHY|nr:hypothetical protein OBBRIDRAFT_890527 [Obba rivulosa]